MALDILHDNWGPYTHTEVENALKAYLSGLDDRINKAIQSGGVGLTDLSQEVQALLNKADTALQSETDPTVPNWAKQSNKPTYNVSEIIFSSNRPLSSKLDEMTAEILAAGATDSEMSDSSKKPVQNKVIKAYVDGLIQGLQNVLNTITQDGATQGVIDTFNEVKAFLEGISSSDTLAAKLATLVPQTRTINGKALSSNVTIGMSDIQGLVDAINNAGSGAVSVTTNQDGTFVIHVGETDYTINLNHTHENMAKLVKCTEATLPQTMADDTIYVQVDDLQAPSVIEKLYLFGLAFEGGGGVIDETPRLTSPAVGTEIDFLGQSSTTLRVKGIYLGAQLTITKTGDLAVTDGQGNAVSTISATDANNGIELTIAKGTNYTNEGASLTISSGEVTRTVVVKDSTILPGGLFADKAWATQGQSYQKPVELSGYCITKFFFTQNDSSNKCNITVNAGVSIESSGLAWIGTGWNKKGEDNTAFDENTTDARGYYSMPRNFKIDRGDGVCISATFKTSEIANCYIYDHIAGKYLWAGENVDTSVAPPIPS